MKLIYKQIEDLLARLSASLAVALSQSEISDIQDLTDVAEYGLAFETAVAIVLEQNKKISRESLDLFCQLAVAMHMDEEGLNEKLSYHLIGD